MRTGKDVEFAPFAAGSVARGSVWTLEAAPGQSRSSPGDGSSAPPDLAELEWATLRVRMALMEMTVAAQAAVAGARAIVEVMDAAVAVLDVAERASASESIARVPAPQRGMLSPREREVLALVAEGRSNKAIAEALYVSPNTIKTHIASLMTKLQAESRAQLAAIATRQAVHHDAARSLERLEPLAS